MGKFILGCIIGMLLFGKSKRKTKSTKIGQIERPSGKRPPDPPDMNPSKNQS